MFGPVLSNGHRITSPGHLRYLDFRRRPHDGEDGEDLLVSANHVHIAEVEAVVDVGHGEAVKAIGVLAESSLQSPGQAS